MFPRFRHDDGRRALGELFFSSSRLFRPGSSSVVAEAVRVRESSARLMSRNEAGLTLAGLIKR
jgi:hypothetical protein